MAVAGSYFKIQWRCISLLLWCTEVRNRMCEYVLYLSAKEVLEGFLSTFIEVF